MTKPSIRRRGAPLEGQNNFFWYERQGGASKPDFFFERFGEIGGERERRQLAELAAASPELAHMFTPEKRHAVVMVAKACHVLQFAGQIALEATMTGKIKINHKFVFGIEPKFFLGINALVTSDIVFSIKDAEDELYVTGGPTMVWINAMLQGSFMLRMEPGVSGGLGSKQVRVMTSLHGDLQVICRGASNYCDWTLDVCGGVGDTKLSTDNIIGKMRGRKLIVEDSEEAGVRRIVITDVAA